MKKVTAFLLSVMLVMSASYTAYGMEYTDVKSGNWAHEAISTMSNKAIIKGYPDGTFKPNNTITYGEFIKMALIASTGEDVGNAESGNWATNYYNSALENQYFTKYDIDKSQLDYQIPRSDMALIISTIIGDVTIENYDEIQKGITDISHNIKHEYEITKSYASGILTGYEDGTFKPQNTLTRAESATVIYRLMDESKRVLPGVEEEEEDSTETNNGYRLVNTADFVDVSTVKNVRTLNANDKYSTYGDFTEKAELYTDASKFDIAIFRNYDGEDCSFDHKLNGFIYLVKDGKMVEFAGTLPRYDADGNFLYYYRSIAHIDVTTVDYILVTRPEGSGDLVKLVRNPFK